MNKRQKAVLDDIAKRQARGDGTQIDYSDIPALSDKQLAEFKRTDTGYSSPISNLLRVIIPQQR